MARALIAVGAALALLIGGLALAVFVTRDEDNIQVDNLLSERFTREAASASTNGTDLDLGQIAPFEWVRVLIVARGVPGATTSALAQSNGANSRTSTSAWRASASWTSRVKSSDSALSTWSLSLPLVRTTASTRPPTSSASAVPTAIRARVIALAH